MDGTTADPVRPIRQYEGVPFYVVPYVCHPGSSLRLHLRAGSRRMEPAMPSSQSVDHAVANQCISLERVIPKAITLRTLYFTPLMKFHLSKGTSISFFRESYGQQVQAYLSMKCWERSTTDGPTMVKELSCHGIRAKIRLSFRHCYTDPYQTLTGILYRQSIARKFVDGLEVHQS